MFSQKMADIHDLLNDGNDEIFLNIQMYNGDQNNAQLSQIDNGVQGNAAQWSPEVRQRIEDVRKNVPIAQMYLRNHFYCFEQWQYIWLKCSLKITFPITSTICVTRIVCFFLETEQHMRS